jgi:hypothetical protein
MKAHRAVYELLVGPIPPDLPMDHLCGVTSCVNPAHLQIVTPRENVVRGRGPATAGARNAAKTQCPHGHPYDAANTRHDSAGRRRCRTCERMTYERKRVHHFM